MRAWRSRLHGTKSRVYSGGFRVIFKGLKTLFRAGISGNGRARCTAGTTMGGAGQTGRRAARSIAGSRTPPAAPTSLCILCRYVCAYRMCSLIYIESVLLPAAPTSLCILCSRIKRKYTDTFTAHSPASLSKTGHYLWGPWTRGCCPTNRPQGSPGEIFRSGAHLAASL